MGKGRSVSDRKANPGIKVIKSIEVVTVVDEGRKEGKALSVHWRYLLSLSTLKWR